MTTNAANDIFKQASQGSVAAIIQVLNDKLADSGVRTRAMLADGVLQLLCEAATLDQLDQTILTDRIQQILETIAPRGIRRVKINSRIVREQQLLWLEEISRDPTNQLLWSQEITLKKPSFLQQVARDWQHNQSDANYAGLPTRSPRQMREQRQFQRGSLIGGAIVAAAAIVGWTVYSQIQRSAEPQAKAPDPAAGTISPISTPAPAKPAPAPSPSQVGSSQTNSQPATTQPSPSGDPFVNAVRIAEQTSQAGQAARSTADWLSLAARWQEASDLMSQVPSTDGRYQTAQDRVGVYRANSESALQKARSQ